MRDGIDGLVGGALDREDFVSEIGIGGDHLCCFFRELLGRGLQFCLSDRTSRRYVPTCLDFDLIGIDGVEKVARDS